ncbi:hypothetical protein [Flammeovirga sp. EKP202]|uniref:hypothetical protein n=1 Tax=Flammeovirga sp. EKP202 TaxID=2770592 RepID=UPI00165FA23B|nr:hypothetical protein [Flammeovirga sp. EKP202]MBD0400895.1 hypothetical protein [Flammeovirga sp. EKP202]
MSEISKKIELSYINFILLHNKRPNSVNDLISNELEENKTEILEEYKEINKIETQIWESGIMTAFQHSENDPNYAEYTVREKLLSFFYNYAEVLKKEEKFYEYSANIHSIFELSILNERSSVLKNVFLNNVNGIIKSGIETGEVADRFFISDYYGDIIWYQALLIIRYCISDESNEKENTDEIIEKSVNLIMDLFEPNFTDSAFLLAKFLFQK